MSRRPIERLLVLGGGSEIAAAFIGHCATMGLKSAVLAGRPNGTTAAALLELSSSFPELELNSVAFDATEPHSHSSVLASADSEHGPFDAVLVAFGVLGEPFTLDLDPRDGAELVLANFAGAVSACLGSISILRGEPNARLIVISSIAAVRSRVANLIYGASKSGLDTFVTGLRNPANKVGVDVVVVRPGFVHGRMTEGLDPAPLSVTPQKVASDMVKGLDAGKATIFSPPLLRPIAQVFTHLPGPVWRKVSAR